MSIRQSFASLLPLDTGVARRAVMAAVLVLGAIAASMPAKAASVAETFAPHAKGSTVTVDHAAWDKLLKSYVVPGQDGVSRVRYAKFKAEGHAALKGYVAALEKVDVATLDRPEQFAYLGQPLQRENDRRRARQVSGQVDQGHQPRRRPADAGDRWPVESEDRQGQGPGSVTRRHRTRHSSPRFQGPARPLCRQLRVVRLPQSAAPRRSPAPGSKRSSMPARRPTSIIRVGCGLDGGKLVASSIYNWFQADFGGSDKGVLEHSAQVCETRTQARNSTPRPVSPTTTTIGP